MGFTNVTHEPRGHYWLLELLKSGEERELPAKFTDEERALLAARDHLLERGDDQVIEILVISPDGGATYATHELLRRVTTRRPLGEVETGRLFIMGMDADPWARHLGAVNIMSGEYEVYKRVRGGAHNLVDDCFYPIPDKCPVIPIFIGSQSLARR